MSARTQIAIMAAALAVALLLVGAAHAVMRLAVPNGVAVTELTRP